MDEVLGTERGVDVEAEVLELEVGAAVGTLGEGHLTEEAEALAERARREEIGLLRKLEIVADDVLATLVVARGVQARHLHVHGEGRAPRQLARIDHLRPEALVGFGAEIDRFLLDLLLGLRRKPVAVEPKGFAEGVELREDGVARHA